MDREGSCRRSGHAPCPLGAMGLPRAGLDELQEPLEGFSALGAWPWGFSFYPVIFFKVFV